MSNDMDWIQDVYKLLQKHEGYEKKPYVDTVGKITIGVGYNLTDNGLPDDVIMMLLYRTVKYAINDVISLVPNFDQLSPTRKIALTDWSFNLGLNKMKQFKNTLQFINDGQWDKAADGMMNSLWAKQVGQRAKDISEMVRHG